MRSLIDFYSEREFCYAATIELCTTCNWRCLHCYLPQHTSLGFSFEKVCEILDKLRNFGVYELTLTGGEIFTRSDCMEIIKSARQRGFAVHVLSNASLLTDESVKKLCNMHIESFDCTIFSMDKTVHERFVQVPGSLAKSLQNILKLKRAGINVLVKCILTKYNWQSYRAIKEFCIENEIAYLFTLNLYKKRDGDGLPLEMTVPDEHLDELIRETSENDGYCYKGISAEDYICKSSRYSMFIDVQGNVHPCGNYVRNVGNICETPVECIWNSDELRKIRNQKLKDTIKCKSCHLRERCFVCAGINEHEGYTSLGYREFDCKLATLREKNFCV